MKAIPIAAAFILLFVCAHGFWPDAVHAQVSAGILANWGDGETWSRYIDADAQTEMGLGLQPSGPAGTMRLAITARLRGRVPTAPPAQLTVHAAVSPGVNPNAVRTATLSFLLDKDTSRRTSIDLASRLQIDLPFAGAAVNSGIASLSPTEFVRIAEADTASATVLGVDVELRPAQLRAIRAFGERIFLLPRSSASGSAGTALPGGMDHLRTRRPPKS